MNDRPMADQNLNAVGCLGRALTTIGLVWMGIVVLGGLGVLSELGMSGGFIAAIAGTFFPAVILIVIGRALNRRARSMRERAPSSTSGLPVPESRVPSSRQDRPERVVTTPPILPDSSVPPPSKPPPPAMDPAPRRVEPLQVPRQRDPLPPPRQPEPSVDIEEMIPPAIEPPPPRPMSGTLSGADTEERPKSSREMIEEARAKWGARKKG